MDINILGYFREKTKLDKIKHDLVSLDTSKTYLGESAYSDNLKLLLGHNYFRSIGYSRGFNEMQLEINNITAIGGWCAVRTKDFENIKRGVLENPLSGELSPISKIADVTSWLRKSQSLDQIIESVGTFTGDKYVIMSERRLWTTKLEKALEKFFQRSLSQKETQNLYEAVIFSETRKYEMTKKYIDFVTKKSNFVTEIRDEDYMQEIEKNKNRLLENHKIDLDKLTALFINQKSQDRDITNDEKKELADYISEYTKVWYFFTGDYLENILKKNGIVRTEKAVLINCWQYSVNYQIKLEQIINKIVLNQGKGYLSKGFENENIWFVAYLSAEDYRFRQYKTHKSLSLIPNATNFKNYLLSLTEHVNKLNTTFLSNDIFFQDIFNFAQDFESVQILKQITNENSEFSNVRNSIKQSDNQQKLKVISEIRKMKLSNTLPKIEKLLVRYSELLNTVFNGSL